MDPSSNNSKKEKESYESHMPLDLVSDIIRDFPVKDLCKLKCVSKHWLNLIEDPSFVEMIRKPTPFQWLIELSEGMQVYSIDVNGVSTPVHRYGFDLQPLDENWEPSRKQHVFEYGFALAMRNFRYCAGHFFYIANGIELVWGDAITGDYQDLPSPGIKYFEPGFDPVLKKTKILGWGKSNNPRQFWVLTLGARDSSWRPVPNVPKIGRLEEFITSVTTANGMIFMFDHQEEKIVSFDVTREKFGIIELPGKANYQDFAYNLIAFEGCVCWVERRMTELVIANLWMFKGIDWVSLMENVALPTEGTTMAKYYSGDPYSTVMDCDISARDCEILMPVSDFGKHYLFFYSFLDKRFRRVEISGELQVDSAIPLKNRVLYEFV